MTKLLLIAALILPFVTQSSTILRSSVSQHSNGDDWQRMVLREEEFSVFVPIQPNALVQPDEYSFSGGGEKVLGYRAYSGYASGFIFVVESYRAARPQKLIKDVNRLFRNLGRVPLEPSNDKNFVGFGASKYTLGRNNFTGNVYVFAGRQHVYVVIVAAKTAGHPSFNRFLSSFTLGENAVAGSVMPKAEDDSATAGPAPESVVPTEETTMKAIVVWKPEPNYTEVARLNQRTGTVVLKGTFTSSGQVVITDLIKPLKDGLTEQAIAVAKNIKFFPAEKDGQLVSVSLQLEYNFNLY